MKVVDAMGRIEIDVDDRVRIVTMNGCMGHVRDNPREGSVAEIEMKTLHGGGSQKFRYAKIKLDNGEVEEKSAEPRFWSMHEGLPEYQQ